MVRRRSNPKTAARRTRIGQLPAEQIPAEELEGASEDADRAGTSFAVDPDFKAELRRRLAEEPIRGDRWLEDIKKDVEREVGFSLTPKKRRKRPGRG